MMKTYAHDRELPALPVPDLHTTCARIAAMVAPLVDEHTLENTRKAVADFSRPGGQGESLHNALLRYKDGLPGNASWLRAFWDDMYAAWRGKLPLDMNYAFRFDSERWGRERALPRFVRALASVLRDLAGGALEPEQSKAGYLSMDQAAKVLYTRIPARGADTLMPVKPEGQEHVAVACRGHWFLVPLLRADGLPQSEEALHVSFMSIRAEAATLPPAPCVGAITSVSGEERALLRARLQQTLQNRLSLTALENTLFVVCLDDAHTDDNDMMRRLIAGATGNRWFAKSLQIVATENGGLGANFEHAGCDAAIWLYLLGQADARIRESATLAETRQHPRDEAAGAAEDASLTRKEGLALRRLAWDVPPDLRHCLAEAEDVFARQCAALQVNCRAHPELSRDSLKSLQTSPDAFLQIAFQVAQHHVFGKLRSSYEAVAVRGFAYGRTECARACTSQALAFAQALGHAADADCLALYRAAEQAHLAQLVQCQHGEGVERHMYGLAAMHRLFGAELGMEAAPALFSDPGWLVLKHDALSTSGIGAPFIAYFGFGPVVEDGLGIGYAPSAAGTGLTVTCGETDPALAARFAESFASAVHRMTALLRH